MTAEPARAKRIDINVTCPKCGQPMVARHNKATGGEFLGCSQWPACNETQTMPTYVRLLRDGATQLPGMEGL